MKVAAQVRECRFVRLSGVALTDEGVASRVGNEPEPVEIVEECAFVLGTAADPVVIFEPEQDTCACPPRMTPDIDRVDDVAEMKKPGG
jgi:hypothetical protein